jgi:hypothetical protein
MSEWKIVSEKKSGLAAAQRESKKRSKGSSPRNVLINFIAINFYA